MTAYCASCGQPLEIDEVRESSSRPSVYGSELQEFVESERKYINEITRKDPYYKKVICGKTINLGLSKLFFVENHGCKITNPIFCLENCPPELKKDLAVYNFFEYDGNNKKNR